MVGDNRVDNDKADNDKADNDRADNDRVDNEGVALTPKAIFLTPIIFGAPKSNF